MIWLVLDATGYPIEAFKTKEAAAAFSYKWIGTRLLAMTPRD